MRSAPAAPRPTTRFAISLLASDELFVNNLRATMALSEDGETLVYVATRDGVQQLHRRPLGQLDALPIPGTEGASSPFFSPDGDWIGFEVNGTLKRMAVTGGPAATLYEGPTAATDVSWGTNDMIVFGLGTDGNPIMQVASTGGVTEPVTTLEEGETDHRQPALLPGGTALLFTVASGPDSSIAVKSMSTGERRVLFVGSSPRYTSSGHIIFARENALWAVPFDADQLSGSLVYVPGTAAVGDARSLVWVDRQGQEEEIPAPTAPYESPRLSLDERHVAAAVNAPENADVMVFDLQRETLTRLTFDPEGDMYPLWSSDGQRVLFSSTREGPPNIYSKAADGRAHDGRRHPRSGWRGLPSIRHGPGVARPAFREDALRQRLAGVPQTREEAEPFLDELRATFLPNRILAVVAEGDELDRHTVLIPLLEGKVARDSKPTAYVCENRICDLPTTDPAVFATQIRTTHELG